MTAVNTFEAPFICQPKSALRLEGQVASQPRAEPYCDFGAEIEIVEEWLCPPRTDMRVGLGKPQLTFAHPSTVSLSNIHNLASSH